jgi:hypothetical protein
MTCQLTYCHECGDRMIHQTNRGPHESSSAYGQHVHERYGRTFYFTDGDALTFKRSSQILRVIEHKYSGGVLSPGQRVILPLIAIGLDSLAHLHGVDPASGVFVMYADAPFECVAVRRVMPDITFTLGEPQLLAGPALDAFNTGERVDP